MKTKIEKFYTLLIILFPIIYTYQSPISQLTIADILLIVISFLGIICMLNGEKKIKFPMPFILIIFYLIVHQLIIFLCYEFNYGNLMVFARILFYFITIFLFSRHFFNLELGMKMYKISAVFSSVYIIVQYLAMKVLKFYIPGTLPFLKVSEDIATFNIKMQNGLFDRPRSIFIEPAHFAIYVSIFLAIYLINSKKVDFKLLFILTLGLLLSGSTTGIGIAIIIYMIYFLKNISLKKSQIKKNILLISALTIILFIFVRTQSFDIFMGRTVDTSFAIDGRFSSYNILLDNSFDMARKVFGIGFFKNEEFYPSLIRIFLFDGLLGLFIYHFAIILLLIRGNKTGKIVTILLYVFSLSSSIVYSRWIVLILPIIINNLNCIEMTTQKTNQYDFSNVEEAGENLEKNNQNYI